MREVPLEKTATYQRTNCSFPNIGPCRMNTPRGAVEVEDVPGFMTMEIHGADGPMSVAVLVYEPEPGRGHGYIVQFSADNARAVAGSLMAMADKIEPPRQDA